MISIKSQQILKTDIPGYSGFSSDKNILDNEVHIWQASLRISENTRQKLWKILSSDEQMRADKFRFEQDQRRFISARGFLRKILSNYLDLKPEEIKFVYGPTGKPELSSCCNKRNLNFNLSHSKEMALYAVTYNRSIGIDIVPGASLIELALSYMEKALKKSVSNLQNIILQKPGVVEREHPLEITVVLEKDRFSLENNSNILCAGKAILSEEKQLPSLNISSYTSKQSKNIGNLYSLFSDLGYQYGDDLKVVENAWENDQNLLLKIKNNNHDEESVTFLSPIMLDGVFQSVLAAEFLENLGGQVPENNFLYIPYFIKSFHILGELKDSCFVLINKKDIQKKGMDITIQLKVYDSSGKAVLWIQDMVFKGVLQQFLNQNNLINTNIIDNNQIDYYKPVWEKKLLLSNSNNPNQSNAILFTNSDNLSNQLAREITSQYKKSYTIHKGEVYSNRNKTEFEINSNKEQDYLDVLQNIKKQTDDDIKQFDIYYLYPYEPEIVSIDNLQALKQKIDKSLRSFFFLTKALNRCFVKYTTKIMVITNEVYVVEPFDTGKCFSHGAISGFAKTIMLENPKIKIKMIDFEKNNLSSLKKAQLIIKESTAEVNSKINGIIAYRGEIRYVQTIKPVLFRKDQIEQVFKNKGTYIIIGGAGGIGMKVAKMISEHVKARLIIVGRSSLSTEKRI